MKNVVNWRVVLSRVYKLPFKSLTTYLFVSTGSDRMKLMRATCAAVRSVCEVAELGAVA